MIENLFFWNSEKTEKLKSKIVENSIKTNDNTKQIRAGVLLPLYEERGRLIAIYIRRTRYFLGDGREAIHSGQIAFPGGKIEHGETLQHAAQREAEEEVGLSSGKIDVLGTLGTFVTLTSNIASTVYIGWLKEKPALARNKREVAAIYHIPLHEVADQHLPELDLNQLEHVLVLHYHWQPPEEKRPICIWGMTARVTWQLFSIIRKICSV